MAGVLKFPYYLIYKSNVQNSFHIPLRFFEEGEGDEYLPEFLREEFTSLLVCKNNVCPEFYVLVHDEIHQKDSVNSFYFKFPVVPRPALVDDGTGEIENGAFFKVALHAVCISTIIFSPVSVVQ